MMFHVYNYLVTKQQWEDQGYKMTRLEYRLLDEEHGFPIVSYYDHITIEEILLRFACDYFVQDNRVFEKTSCAIENSTYVIYVKLNQEEKVIDQGLIFAPHWKGIRIEVRHFQEQVSQNELIDQVDFREVKEALAYLLSDYILLNGEEWEKCSTEVDENRKLYVYYAQPTA
jgi:hypothetical protein